MTEATKMALTGLRDLSTLKWYAIPILAIIFYIYQKEIHKAKNTKNWEPIFAAVTVFGLDFFNETWNGWVLALTGRSALWTAPGETAFRSTVGWNLEIMFMFSILGYIYYYTLSEKRDRKILGLNEKWAVGILYSIVCVIVECLLNAGGLLVWEYPFWNRSIVGVWLIFLIGYYIFFLGAGIILTLKKNRSRIIMVSVIYAVPIIMNNIAASLGWRY